MNPAIIIPTFHCPAARKRRSAVSDIYDHPTPLNEEGFLERCLNSLQKVKGLGQVIITVSSEGGVNDEAASKVQAIVDKYPNMHTFVIADAEATIVQQRLEQLGFGDLSDQIGLTGYSAVRNLGLVVANILGFDAVVFVDEDEVFEDNEFLSKDNYAL